MTLLNLTEVSKDSQDKVAIMTMNDRISTIQSEFECLWDELGVQYFAPNAKARCEALSNALWDDVSQAGYLVQQISKAKVSLQLSSTGNIYHNSSATSDRDVRKN